MKPTTPCASFRARNALFVSVLALALGIPSSSWARQFRTEQVPNGTGQCNLCHAAGSGYTGFGNDARRTFQGRDVNWSAIFDLDSDGDGYTNGEELGDPLGVWTQGGFPEFQRLSQPEDRNNTPFPPIEAPIPSPLSLDLDEDASADFTLTATDPDNSGVLYYRVVEAPSLGTIELNRATGEGVYTGNPNASGQDSFSYWIFDGSGFTDPIEVSVEIAEINDPPEINIRSSYPAAISEFLEIPLVALDPEDGEVPVMIQGSLPEGAEVRNGTLRWTPTEGQQGTYPLSFWAQDRQGERASVNSEIVVTDVILPEELEIRGNLTGEEGDTLMIAAYVQGGSRQNVTWNFGDGSPTESGINLNEVEHQYTQSGSFRIQVTVEDAGVTHEAVEFARLDNIDPTVDAGPDKTVEVGQEVTFQGSASDPSPQDQAELRYFWSFGDESPDVIGAASASHTYTQTGTYEATFTVLDDSGRGSDSLIVEVVPVGDGNNAGNNDTENNDTENNDSPDMGLPGDMGDGGEDSGTQDTCEPGITSICVCSESEFGQRTCGSLGLWGSCQCSSDAQDDGCNVPAGKPHESPTLPLFLLLGGLLWMRRR